MLSSLRQLIVTVSIVSLIAIVGGGCSPSDTQEPDAVSIDPDAIASNDSQADTTADTKVPIPDGGVCSPGSVDGCANANALKKCAEDGSGWIADPCYGSDGSPTNCKLPGVCGACAPGSKRCSDKDSTVVQNCSAAGAWEDAQTCDGEAGKQCFNGLCAEACEINVKANSYIGCSFWATDLDNAFVPGGKRGYYDAAGAQYAVVVSNPSDKLAANIKIETNEGEVKVDAKGDDLDLSPLKAGELRVYNLPPRNINGTVQAKLAYKISSSVPITAYQFNPLENVNVFSNDASLLLPEELLGKYYMVMSREQSFSVLRGFITIVATLGGTTTVNVQFSKTTGKTLASSTGKKIKVFNGGEGGEFILNQWDTLNIESDLVGSDLTGSIVTANKRVAVFAGSEAANAPNTNRCDVDLCTDKELSSNIKCGVCAYDKKTPCYKNEQCSQFITCCADHLEMQMFPIKTWGSHYVAVKLFPRGQESDYWRIMAAEDGTKVTTIPPIKNQDGKNVYVPVLNKGEWYEIETTKSFEIVAKKGDGSPAPIMVGHFMASQDAPDPNSVGPQPGDAGTGDPAFLLSIPVAQWRTEFVFLAPNKYAMNYISVAAPMDAKVSFNGKQLSPDYFEKVSKSYKMTRIFVGEGVHRVKSDKPVAVDVYGFDQYVSYGYPAGLDLKDLKLVKEPGD
ncbi:MAG: IgGFc-binding protein [Myxococcales bacterium]|nr:IgGFc-binding protein [Myxococcales bacterium]